MQKNMAFDGKTFVATPQCCSLKDIKISILNVSDNTDKRFFLRKDVYD